MNRLLLGLLVAPCTFALVGLAGAQTSGNTPLVSYLTPGPTQNEYSTSFVEAGGIE